MSPTITSPKTLLLWRIDGSCPAAAADTIIATITRCAGSRAQTVEGQPAGLFASPHEAATAATSIQRAIQTTISCTTTIALHTGSFGQAGSAVFGGVVKRVSALLQAGKPNQILLTEPTAQLLGQDLPDGMQIVALGRQRLFDLLAAEPISELVGPEQVAIGALNSLDLYQHNLPIQPTPFIGRMREVAAMCTLLKHEETRLLTLVATSGTGKTRFGLEVAVRMLNTFTDGIYFVPLAPVTEPQLVVNQIGAALGLRERTGQPLISQIVEYLQDRTSLLILDNFEQVLAASRVVAELLEGTRNLRIIATSHVPLRVPGEHVQYVPPMDLPNPEQYTSLLDLIHYDSIGLFIERAQAADPDFTLTETNGPIIAALVARLGGLPLAIDLVAPYVDTLTLPNLLQELGDYKLSSLPLPMLLDWAYHRLPTTTRQVFARLGVFAGGCTFDVAEQICRVGQEDLDVTNELQHLVHRNLMFPEKLHAGLVRYIMLDSVHDRARMHLVDQSEVGVLARRHSAFYVGLAKQGYSGLHGEQQSDWLLRLTSEQHNMRQAFRWAQNNQSYEVAGQFIGSLGRYWHLSGAFSEGQRWIDPVLPHCSRMSAPIQAQVLNVATIIYGEQGFYDRATSAVNLALALHRSLGDAEGEYHALNNLGVLSAVQSEFAQATEHYTASLRLAQQIGNARLYALALNNLGDLAMEQGDYGTAEKYLAEAQGLAKRSGDQIRNIDLLSSLGWVQYALGNREKARTSFSEALIISRDMQSDIALPLLIEGAAAVAYGSTAARLLGAVEALRETTNRPLPDVYQERVTTVIAQTRTQLTPYEFERAWTDGRSLSESQIISQALEALAQSIHAGLGV